MNAVTFNCIENPTSSMVGIAEGNTKNFHYFNTVVQFQEDSNDGEAMGLSFQTKS